MNDGRVCDARRRGGTRLRSPRARSPSPKTKQNADLFNKISHSCFNKCVGRKHREPDLALGEMTCTDRCVSKYLEAQQRVGAVLQEANEQQLQQQKSMVDMQQSFGGK